VISVQNSLRYGNLPITIKLFLKLLDQYVNDLISLLTSRITEMREQKVQRLPTAPIYLRLWPVRAITGQSFFLAVCAARSTFGIAAVLRAQQVQSPIVSQRFKNGKQFITVSHIANARTNGWDQKCNGRDRFRGLRDAAR